MRADKLPERAAQIVGEPGGQRLAAVELADAVGGDFEGFARGGIQGFERSSQGIGGDSNRRIGGKTIQFAAPLAQGGIAS